MAKGSNKQDSANVVREVIEEFHAQKDELIPILLKINKELGYVSSSTLDQISTTMRIPKSQLQGVASFYSMIFTDKIGEHVIKFCESAPCHVEGGKAVWEKLQATLDLSSGETSEDGKWTLTTTSCLGLCAEGPVMMVDEDIYEKVSPDQIPSILGKYS
ncbi:MAG TPA: NADH-quinone oxidoreductase subunit NuoE [Anaerolineales bacterium]|nr:NADH-quinone oxidoreductase subunit NuoE [Anaerolineales bacterium]